MSKYSVKLTPEQRTMLEEKVKKGEAPAREIMHAHILLKTDSGKQGPRWSSQRIQEALEVGSTVIKTVRKRFIENGIKDALERKKQPARPKKRKINGEQEAHIIATLCTEEPEGRTTWSLRALTDRIIELEIVETVSHETVRTVLRKNELKPWQTKRWCIGPKNKDSSYVFHMEDVLDVYMQPYDEKRPQVCLDEGSIQFLKDLEEPLEMKQGKIRKEDYHYEHEGYCNIFLACEPLSGKRFVHVTERRTKIDFAHFLRHIVEVEYARAEKIILVMDNLNTHILGALYDAFPAEEAKRIWKRVEIHYTPTHASWLNMAEIELSVVGRQALTERLRNIALVRQRVDDWQAKRNKQKSAINWRFSAEDARIKLKRLYPVTEDDCSGEHGRNEV